MKYVCKICGYVYDDDSQKIPFSELPDTWVCPLCGAKKSDFDPQGINVADAENKQPVHIDKDMLKLSIGQVAALCSNLARGCEKQYKPDASEQYRILAEYFSSITPAVSQTEISDLSKLIQEDLEGGYGNVRQVAGEHNDRGALRVCVWGEKVTRILAALLERYKQEGENFLADTEIWVCTTCGFVWVGDAAPSICPVCKVPDWKFEKIERRQTI